MKKIITLITALAIVLPMMSQNGKLKLSQMLGDNMVLEQSTSARLWGESAANAKVSITPSWSSKTVETKADKDGRWELAVETPSATFDPQTITIVSGNETLKVGNVLIGEVWMCSGQSNMEMQLSGGFGTPVEGSLEEIAMSKQYEGVRYMAVKKARASEPQQDGGGEWKECNPMNAGSFSAVGYFFASRLSKALDVPVGIINFSWGGSVIEAWMSKELLQNCPDVDLNNADNDQMNDMYKPMIMYNAMFRPASRYTVKGIIWYQGESNVTVAREDYANRLTNMAALWRKDIGLGEIPFFIIELPPYDYNDGQYGLQDGTGPLMREQQYKASQMIPNSGYICTNDLAYPYEAPQVHPSQKRQVGERCCYLAMNKVYGYSTVQALSPTFKSMEVKDGKVIIRFDNARSGFLGVDEIKGFEIAGGSKNFHPAKATVGFGSVTLSNDLVTQPEAVRYCFKDFEVGTLKSGAGLPVVPFRTDEW